MLQSTDGQARLRQLMRDVEAAGNSSCGGLPGDNRAHAHQQEHWLTSQVRSLHQQLQLLADQVIRLNAALATQTSHSHALERRFTLLEEAGTLAGLHLGSTVAQSSAQSPLDTEPDQSSPPTPLAPLMVPPLQRAARSGLDTETDQSGPPTPVGPAVAVPLSKPPSSSNLATLPLMPSVGVAVPAHSRTSAPVPMPAAAKPPPAAEGAEAAWSTQPSHMPMRAAPMGAQMQPYFFGGGEAPWLSPSNTCSGMCGLQYMMPPPQQQQQMAMQMQQMQQIPQMRSSQMQTSPLMAPGQTHYCQPLMSMGQAQHMHMNQQQCMVPMPPVMYCSPQIGVQPHQPAGSSRGPANPLKRGSPETGHLAFAPDGSGARVRKASRPAAAEPPPASGWEMEARAS